MSPSQQPQERIAVGILGATGTVGQRFITLLANHPYFYIKSIGASERSAGKPYRQATISSWKQTVAAPEEIASMIVTTCEPKHFTGCKIIFSGLDSDVAGKIETDFIQADFVVLSNAKNHRMDPMVPLIVPLVNTDHMDMIPHQRSARGLRKGFLITNANCSVTGLAVPLKALQDKFGTLSKVIVTTMQAISGAGYPGVPSLDIFDNVVPYISGEEEKMEAEALKILGNVSLAAGSGQNASFVDKTGMRVSASCNRVAVIDGHTESVSIEFERKPAPSVDEIIKCLEEYTCDAQKVGAPSAPKRAVIVRKENDRPQPRLDRDAEGGYAVSVGRVRECNVFDVKFTVLSHNTILGAAGSAILNAEVAVAKGLIA
ncbi:hypothetical protein HDU76_013899 [Blyttiomyces sp. JEL0837]|nr:hypothetical protein HDU76_013899 [Blyttiomyces sp. JEL0837]